MYGYRQRRRLPRDLQQGGGGAQQVVARDAGEDGVPVGLVEAGDAGGEDLADGDSAAVGAVVGPAEAAGAADVGEGHGDAVGQTGGGAAAGGVVDDDEAVVDGHGGGVGGADVALDGGDEDGADAAGGEAAAAGGAVEGAEGVGDARVGADEAHVVVGLLADARLEGRRVEEHRGAGRCLGEHGVVQQPRLGRVGRRHHEQHDVAVRREDVGHERRQHRLGARRRRRHRHLAVLERRERRRAAAGRELRREPRQLHEVADDVGRLLIKPRPWQRLLEAAPGGRDGHDHQRRRPRVGAHVGKVRLETEHVPVLFDAAAVGLWPNLSVVQLCSVLHVPIGGDVAAQPEARRPHLAAEHVDGAQGNVGVGVSLGVGGGARARARARARGVAVDD